MEGLLAFFLEPTFLGLWIFGWDRLPRGLHLCTIWAAAAGTALSAFFILAGSSFMQHTVGYAIHPETGRAVLNDIGAALFQNTTIVAYVHTLSAAFLVSGAGMLAVSVWMLQKDRQREVFRPAAKLGAWVVLIAGAVVAMSGDRDGKIMVLQQPMKMAAAEGLYETTSRAPFSVLSIGNPAGSEATRILEIPGLPSFLATGSFDGIHDIQARYQQTYGPGNYVPYVPVTYWSFRLMIGLGMGATLYALWALWLMRGGRAPQDRLFALVTPFVVLGPLLGISAGWIFTEMGRQPWIVFGRQLTAQGVSALLASIEVWISLAGFTLLYAVLTVIEVRLLLRAIQQGAPEGVVADPYGAASRGDELLHFAY